MPVVADRTNIRDTAPITPGSFVVPGVARATGRAVGVVFVCRGAGLARGSSQGMAGELA
jgi:hypothetical protein